MATTPLSVPAFLSDGRMIEVPGEAVVDWMRETQESNTTLGLADWYTEQGDEHQDEIQGKADYDPRCDHDVKEFSVTNASQAGSYNPLKPHAATHVCRERACVLDSLAWVEKVTGEPGVVIDSERQVHTIVPIPSTAQLLGTNYPLSVEQTDSLVNSKGYATFVVHVDKTEYQIALQNMTEDFVIGDFLHEKVLDFGCCYDYHTNIVAVDGQNFVIEYTTNVLEAIAMENE